MLCRLAWNPSLYLAGDMPAESPANATLEQEPKRKRSLSASRHADGAGQVRMPGWLEAERMAAAASNSLSTAKSWVSSRELTLHGQRVFGCPDSNGSPPAKALPSWDSKEGPASTAQAGHEQERCATSAESVSDISRQQFPTIEADGGSCGVLDSVKAAVPGTSDQANQVDSQADGSVIQVSASPQQAIGSTPFSAFSHHSGANGLAFSDDSETDGNPVGSEHPTVEELKAGTSSNSSGPFGGRGVTLGHMMAAQQQWRQDSFSKAQVCQLMSVLGMLSLLQ